VDASSLPEVAPEQAGKHREVAQGDVLLDRAAAPDAKHTHTGATASDPEDAYVTAAMKSSSEESLLNERQRAWFLDSATPFAIGGIEACAFLLRRRGI